jgi:hypothetical protein
VKARQLTVLALLGAAAAAYAAAAWLVTPGFFDGIAPPSPYRWVSPPPQFRSSNQPPLSGHSTIKVTNGVVDPGTVFTQDGQASISFVPGAFTAPAGGSTVDITVSPQTGFPKPSGITLSTNVYCFTSTSPLAPGKDVLVTLRYSDGVPAPGDVYGYQGSGPWRKLGSTGSAAPYTISVRSSFVGCYGAGYPANAQSSAQGARVGGGQALPVIVALAILLVVLAGIPLAILRRRGLAEEDGEEEEGEEEGEHEERR